MAVGSMLSPWAQPFLRLAGSKRSMIPLLRSLVPLPTATYIEPFAGSACLFFSIPPTYRQRALLGDTNFEFINAYEQVRAHPRRIARRLAVIARTPEEYYKWRARDPLKLSEFERAVRLVYLNRHAFNGIYRENRQGQFNVPFGDASSVALTESWLVRCSYALRTAQCVAADFEDAIAEATPADFVYLDPPYITDRPTFGEYGYGSYNQRDEARLIKALLDLDRRNVSFLLSYSSNSDLQRDGWSYVSFRSPRRVAASADARRATGECLVSNALDLAREIDRRTQQ